jgi:hypothetical protein
MRPSLCLLLLVAGAARAGDGDVDFGGHTKLRAEGQSFPANSLIRELAGSRSIDTEGDLRLNLSGGQGDWSLDAAWQLFLLHGDSIEWSRTLLPLGGVIAERLPTDERRYFDLTHVIHDEDRTAILHRLDRLAIGYTTEKTVVRLGRQALSWGNGLFYTPMDLVNPFDPAAIDTEFKAGDDMLYGQYLRDDGDDIQAAIVARRDPVTGDAERDAATIALKYHGFAGDTEFDLLIADHYADTVVGLGGVRSIGGAIWRGDVVITDAPGDDFVQVVSSLSYSWTWAGRNVSGVLEYYFNGFGQDSPDYDPASLASNPELLARLARRDLFALGRHYVAGSLLVEVTPLLTVTPTLLANAGDPSALLQVVTQYSLGDNLVFLGSANVPLGADGTEFGGIRAGLPGLYLSTSAGLFAQLAWYF